MRGPVMIMAGGTGGHVFPALAVAGELRALGVPVVWLGTHRGLEARLVPAAGIAMEWVQVAGLRGTGVARWLQAPLMLGRALWQALGALRRRRPRLVLGMGGFVSGPGGIVARLLGVPLVIHEQNALPGTTNRWLARVADRVLEGFPGSFAPRAGALHVGNPVRRHLCELPPPGERFRARSGPARLLILGGSQGARDLNTLIPGALLALAQPLEVRHQTGERWLAVTEAAYREVGLTARCEAFIEDMAGAYGWADLVLCRAGALTVAELAAVGVGAILVPYPHAVDDHQSANACYLVAAGAARLAPQQSLSTERLAELLGELLGDRTVLLGMAEAARQLAQPGAARRIAGLCLETAGSKTTNNGSNA